MRLPINIEELLGGRAVEGDRIEYKTGWNPDAIYRSVCAFANDFDETGGGYIVVGVKEVNGRPVRPVVGIDPNQIEPIEKDMVGFNNLMQPYCISRRLMGRRFWSSRCRLANVALTRCLIKLPPSRRRTTTTSDTTVAALCPRVNMSAN